MGDLPEFFKVAANTNDLEKLKPDIAAANIVCPFVLRDINNAAVEAEDWLRELNMTNLITDEQKEQWHKVILDALLEFALIPRS